MEHQASPEAQQAPKDCLFCRIVAGEIPSTTVYEDDLVYAFKDIHPEAPVHDLVIPKHHYDNVAQLAAASPETLQRIVKVAQAIADQEYDGSFQLGFNTGANAGQTVFHVHAHVLTGEKQQPFQQAHNLVRGK